MTDALAMIRACAVGQECASERVIRWDGQHVTIDGDATFRIYVWTPEALAAAVLHLAELADSTREEVSAFTAWLPIGRFAFRDTSVRRWRELYRQQKGVTCL